MYFGNKIRKTICISAACLFLVTAKPQPAQAQLCDSSIALAFAATAFGVAQDAAVKALEEVFQLAVEVAYELYHRVIIEETIDTLLNETWRDHLGHQIWDKDDHGWHDALQFTMAQQHLMIAEQTFARGSFADSRQTLKTSNHLAQKQAELRDEMTPSGAVCIADTIAVPYARGILVSKAVQAGFERDVTGLLLNKTDTLTEKGPGQLDAEKWREFTTVFCNHDENNGDMPCDAGLANPNPYRDYDISVADSLYGSDTLDLSVDERRAGVLALTRNLTMLSPNGLLEPHAYTTVVGRNEVFLRRREAARYNAISATVASVWGDRVPYALATDPYVRAVRENAKALSFNISDNPSKYEVRQAMVEQVWSPEFYVENGDDVATVKRRDVVLQAQKLMMLNDLIEKTEKMAVLFSVQLAEELEK